MAADKGFERLLKELLLEPDGVSLLHMLPSNVTPFSDLTMVFVREQSGLTSSSESMGMVADASGE